MNVVDVRRERKAKKSNTPKRSIKKNIPDNPRGRLRRSKNVNVILPPFFLPFSFLFFPFLFLLHFRISIKFYQYSRIVLHISYRISSASMPPPKPPCHIQHKSMYISDGNPTHTSDDGQVNFEPLLAQQRRDGNKKKIDVIREN